MADIEELIDGLLDADQNIHGVAVIGTDGKLITQTENWDISSDVAGLHPIIGGENPGKMVVQGISYLIVEATPERIIGTNVTKKGHLIVAPLKGKGALVCFINPAAGPRDALFNVQEFASKIEKII